MGAGVLVSLSGADSRSRIRAVSIRMRMLATSFLFMFMALLFSADTWAKQEAREQFWTWGIYGSNGHDFYSPEAPIDTRNALQEQQFAECASRDCGSCTKTIYNAPTRVGAATAKINGKFTFLMPDGGTITSYKPACSITGTPASGPTSQPTSGTIAVAAKRWCPSGYGMANGPAHNETIDGYEITTYTSVCVKVVPDPPTCCRVNGIGNTQFGNPIDAIGQAKIESQTDYRSADGLLSVERSYSSQFARWIWNHDVGLVDFTGRGSTSVASTTLIANIKLWPPVLSTGAPPPQTDIPLPFPLTSRLTEQGQPHVWVLGEDGRRIVFNESSTNTFSTTDPRQPRLSLINGPGGSQRWLLRTPGGRFQIIDFNGQIAAQVFADGKSITYARQGGYLTITATPGGRQLVYSRSKSNLPAHTYDVVTLPGGSEIHYEFDASALVTGVTYADTRTKTYMYDEPSYVGTTSGAKRNLLTGITGEDSVRYATYTYNDGAPVSTELAGGVHRYAVSSLFPNFTTIATPPLNGAVRVNFGTGPDGERRLDSRTQPAGAGSASSTTSLPMTRVETSRARSTTRARGPAMRMIRRADWNLSESRR